MARPARRLSGRLAAGLAAALAAASTMHAAEASASQLAG